MRLVKGLGDFTVGVSLPRRASRAGDISEDADAHPQGAAGAEFAITQMVFDVDHYLRLRDELSVAGRGCRSCPRSLITNVRQVVRMAELAGQPMPTAVTDRLDRHGDDAAVRAEGWRSPRSRRGASSTRERPASTSSR